MGLRIALTGVHCWPEVRRGAERYLHELAAALVAAGHRVTVLSTGTVGSGTELGVDVRRLRPSGKADRYGLRGREGRFGAQCLARLGPARLDVWHATSTGDGAAAAAAGRIRPRLRTVFTDHGFPVRESRARRGDAHLHSFLTRHVDSYVCVSTAAGERLVSDYGRVADVVPPGVDTRRFEPGPGRSATPLVLYCGDLAESRKGVGLLLEAMSLLPGVALWLVGPGRSTSDTARAERVFSADPAELPEVYRRAWVTVLPSTAEAFGMTLVESMACGTPVVARDDAGGPSDIVTTETGVLCPGSPASLATALQAALDLSCRPGTVAACRDRAAGFDWRQVVVPRLEELYQR